MSDQVSEHRKGYQTMPLSAHWPWRTCSGWRSPRKTRRAGIPAQGHGRYRVYRKCWALALDQFINLTCDLNRGFFLSSKKTFMIPSLFLAWLHLKVGVHMIMRIQRASTSSDFGWFNPGPKTTTDISFIFASGKLLSTYKDKTLGPQPLDT